MTLAISNNHSMPRLGDIVKRLGVPGVLRILTESWLEYRRSRQVLISSYHLHPMAKTLPQRVWRRHSALFMLMDERAERR